MDLILFSLLTPSGDLAPLRPPSFCSGTAAAASRDAIIVDEGPQNGALSSTGQKLRKVNLANETKSISHQKHLIKNDGNFLLSGCVRPQGNIIC